MTSNLRLLFVYKFCTNGGVEVVLRNRLEILKNYFKDVYADVIFFADYGGLALFKDDLVDHIFIISEPEEIRSFIQERNYDYILSIDTPEIYNIVKGMNVRMILEVHTHYDSNRHYLRSILNDVQNTTMITVPSDYFKKLVEQETGGKVPVYTFPNFISPNFIDQCNHQEMQFPGSHNKAIGWVGRLDSLKNWSELLKIARMVLNRRNDVEFIIVGGHASEETEKAAFFNNLKDNGLLPYTRWLPFYTHMPIFYKYLATTRGCFVSTSRGESFGMTVLESMACNCPVVSTNIGAYSELLDDGKNGMLYNIGDVPDAVNKIERILDDNICREHMIASAHESVMHKYNYINITSDWINLLEEYKNC